MSGLRTEVSMPMLRFAALMWQQVVLAGQVHVSRGNSDTACVRLSLPVTLNTCSSGTWTTRKVADRAWIDAGIDCVESPFAAARTAARTESKSAWLDDNNLSVSTPIDSVTESACTLCTIPRYWPRNQCSGPFLWAWCDVSIRLSVRFMHCFQTTGRISYQLFFEMFSVKWWRDLWNCVRGCSRSLKMAPVDRPYTTSCWSAIESIALCCTIVELK